MGFIEALCRLAPVGVVFALRGPVLMASDQWNAADVCEQVLPAVFRIVSAGDASGDMGTGFFIKADGTGITAAHVVSRGGSFVAKLDSGLEYPMKVVSMHELSDLALVKVQGPGGFTFLKWADSDKARRGEQIIHFGNPGTRTTTEIDIGYIDTVYDGRPNEVRTLNAGRGHIQNTGIQYIMTKGYVKPGFSGGPLVNMKGEVLGVITKLFLQEQVANVEHEGVSIPSNLAKGVIKQFELSGSVKRPYIGLSFVQNNPGLAVVKVQKGSPAEKAGVAIGDVVLSANGKSVDTNEDILTVIGFNLGIVLDLKVNRNNSIVNIKVYT